MLRRLLQHLRQTRKVEKTIGDIYFERCGFLAIITFFSLSLYYDYQSNKLREKLDESQRVKTKLEKLNQLAERFRKQREMFEALKQDYELEIQEPQCGVDFKQHIFCW